MTLPNSLTERQIQREDGGVTIVLPWPARELWPNARPHWSAQRRASKLARTGAWAATKTAGAVIDHDGPIQLHSVFHAPDNRSRDLDNVFAAMKAHRDGIADALKVNDSRFRHLIEWGEPIKGGRVIVRLG